MSKFDFDHLCTVLKELPLPIPDCPLLDLWHYVPSTAGLEATESINGTVNFDLERILGHKVNGLKLTEAGPGVVAIADVLEHFIDQFPCDEVLHLWPPAMLEAAQKVYTTTGETIPSPQECCVGIVRLKRPTATREKDASDDEDATEPILDSRQRKKRKVVQKPTKPAKSTKTISVRPWVDVPEPKSTTGHPHDHLVCELLVLCYDSKDPEQARQLCCVGSINGCPFS
ncbi:hypothetical protein FRC07_012981 [Ceratobasidium sp. 392]|nr:hypothetical protein FRC07_012981 [Ceratobasidium sp. 392]